MSSPYIRIELRKGAPKGAAKTLLITTGEGVYSVSAQAVRRILEHTEISTSGFRISDRTTNVDGAWERDVDFDQHALLSYAPTSPSRVVREAHKNLIARGNSGQKHARLTIVNIDEEEITPCAEGDGGE